MPNWREPGRAHVAGRSLLRVCAGMAGHCLPGADTERENPGVTRPDVSGSPLSVGATQNGVEMSKLRLSITMSLDGFVAGPGHTMDWMAGVSFRAGLVAEYVETTGAVLGGRAGWDQAVSLDHPDPATTAHLDAPRPLVRERWSCSSFTPTFGEQAQRSGSEVRHASHPPTFPPRANPRCTRGASK